MTAVAESLQPFSFVLVHAHISARVSHGHNPSFLPFLLFFLYLLCVCFVLAGTQIRILPDAHSNRRQAAEPKAKPLHGCKRNRNISRPSKAERVVWKRRGKAGHVNEPPVG